jgi:hypothetical protein
MIPIEQALKMSSLELCQRIAEIDRKKADLELDRWHLDYALEQLTGKEYDEFIEGMRKLLAPLPKEGRSCTR